VDTRQVVDIRQVAGIWLPANETHLVPFLEDSVKRGAKRGFYQMHTLSGFLKYVPNDRRKLMLDIGGHVGLWSMHLAKCFENVVAFEPTPVLQECFRRNVLEHPDYPVSNVELMRVALGEKMDTVQISFETDNSGHTHVAPTDATKFIQGAVYYDAPMYPLDSLEFEDVSAIKIDVEGYEPAVLRGAEKTIREFKPVICLEQKPHDFFGWEQYDAARLLISWGAKPVERIVDDFIFVWE
jgi:FkbM family methyltransferase